ncbi:hypothetical protein EVJ58_g262 [Rhodofomes roseus]|uniref:Reverse transcriptase Ty1/copia-type domain-containing protein n=1 Tax=Rhodofomes roseus TaxID=34475 RepID=A0A4Y9Z5F5_9APHY|nr:hypothetical protein EVJ58_g262 [Rhodofomes roseus]
MLIIGRVASLRMSLSQSGFHWDPEHGADIDKHLEWVWQDYVKKTPGAEKFRNKGWPYYELMVHIMPSTAKGTHGFHPATQETGPTSDQQQPPAANEDPEPAEEAGPDNRSAEMRNKFELNRSSTFRYIKGTLDYKLTYSPSSDSELFAPYTNAHHAGCPDTDLSTTGYVMKMGTEFVAAVSAGQEILWLCNLLTELGFDVSLASKLHIDNLPALSVAKSPEHHGHMKHLNLRFYGLRMK